MPLLFIRPPCLERDFVKKQEIRRWQEPAGGREVTSLAMQVDTAESAAICLKNSLMPILRSEEVVWDNCSTGKCHLSRKYELNLVSELQYKKVTEKYHPEL